MSAGVAEGRAVADADFVFGLLAAFGDTFFLLTLFFAGLRAALARLGEDLKNFTASSPGLFKYFTFILVIPRIV